MNPICTLGDYSRPSHEGYRNTIELLERNNVVPLQSDTIRMMMLHDGLTLEQLCMCVKINDGNKKYFVTFIDDASRFCYVYLLHSKDEALDKFKLFKTKVELQQESLIKRFKTDRGGERGIECIFIRYAEHSKAFRLYVTEPNDPVSINSIIESRDAIFDEQRFSSAPRPSQRSLRAKEHVLQIIPKMCLEPAGKEDEVANLLMVNFFEKVLSMSMNKEESPM
nr:zinc finger, CCHC-type [Tanacetum cinerariifolium]